MDKKQAQELRNEYDRHDTAFRAAKKRRDFRKASEHKTKRDAINISEVVRALRSN